MTIRTPIRNFLLTAVFLALCVAGAQTQLVRAQALTDSMPVDPQIAMGKFANGMSYYIRANKKPEKRAELRLVVKAGSILEADDQQGLAHVVEHMAFNGTSHFPKHDVVSFLESLGMRFGADVNAYTSFHETVYILTVPTDAPAVPDRSGTAVSVLTDKELTTTNVEVDYLVPTRPYGTVGVYRQRLIDRLFGSMLSARLSEIAQQAHAPFLGAGTGRGAFVGRSKD